MERQEIVGSLESRERCAAKARSFSAGLKSALLAMTNTAALPMYSLIVCRSADSTAISICRRKASNRHRLSRNRNRSGPANKTTRRKDRSYTERHLIARPPLPFCSSSTYFSSQSLTNM